MKTLAAIVFAMCSLGCATSYQAVGGIAAGADSTLLSLEKFDGALAPALRTPSYLDARTKVVVAYEALGTAIAPGCSSSVSADIAATARAATMLFAQLLAGEQPTAHAGELDPAQIISLVVGGLGAAQQLTSGGLSIYQAIAASQAQAQALCEQKVAAFEQDLAQLRAVLAANDAAAKTSYRRRLVAALIGR